MSTGRRTPTQRNRAGAVLGWNGGARNPHTFMATASEKRRRVRGPQHRREHEAGRARDHVVQNKQPHKSQHRGIRTHLQRATHTGSVDDQGIAEETAGAAGRVVHRKLAKWASKQCGPPATPSPTLANPVQLPSWLRGAGSGVRQWRAATMMRGNFSMCTTP